MFKYILFLYSYNNELDITYDAISLLLRLQLLEVDITIVTDLTSIVERDKKTMKQHFNKITKFNDYVNYYNSWVKMNKPITFGDNKVHFKNKFTKADFDAFLHDGKYDIVHFMGHMSKKHIYHFNLYDLKKLDYKSYEYSSIELSSQLQKLKKNTLLVNDCCFGPSLPEFIKAYKLFYINGKTINIQILGDPITQTSNYKHYVWNVSQHEKHVSYKCTKTIFYFHVVYGQIKNLLDSKIDLGSFSTNLYPPFYAAQYNQTFYLLDHVKD